MATRFGKSNWTDLDRYNLLKICEAEPDWLKRMDELKALYADMNYPPGYFTQNSCREELERILALPTPNLAVDPKKPHFVYSRKIVIQHWIEHLHAKLRKEQASEVELALVETRRQQRNLIELLDPNVKQEVIDKHYEEAKKIAEQFKNDPDFHRMMGAMQKKVSERLAAGEPFNLAILNETLPPTNPSGGGDFDPEANGFLKFNQAEPLLTVEEAVRQAAPVPSSLSTTPLKQKDTRMPDNVLEPEAVTKSTVTKPPKMTKNQKKREKKKEKKIQEKKKAETVEVESMDEPSLEPPSEGHDEVGEIEEKEVEMKNDDVEKTKDDEKDEVVEPMESVESKEEEQVVDEPVQEETKEEKEDEKEEEKEDEKMEEVQEEEKKEEEPSSSAPAPVVKTTRRRGKAAATAALSTPRRTPSSRKKKEPSPPKVDAEDNKDEGVPIDGDEVAVPSPMTSSAPRGRGRPRRKRDGTSPEPAPTAPKRSRGGRAPVVSRTSTPRTLRSEGSVEQSTPVGPALCDTEVQTNITIRSTLAEHFWIDRRRSNYAPTNRRTAHKVKPTGRPNSRSSSASTPARSIAPTTFATTGSQTAAKLDLNSDNVVVLFVDPLPKKYEPPAGQARREPARLNEQTCKEIAIEKAFSLKEKEEEPDNAKEPCNVTLILETNDTLGPKMSVNELVKMVSDPSHPVPREVIESHTDRRRDEKAREEATAMKKRLLALHRETMDSPHADIFKKPVPASEIEYGQVVKEKIDLSMIKREIETESVTNVAGFLNRTYHMLANAIMYNGAEHEVSKMASALVKTVNKFPATPPVEQRSRQHALTTRKAPTVSRDVPTPIVPDIVPDVVPNVVPDVVPDIVPDIDTENEPLPDGPGPSRAPTRGHGRRGGRRGRGSRRH